MRPEPNPLIDRYRRVHPSLGPSEAGCNYGFFVVPQICGTLRIIASDASLRESHGWEHVSVSLEDRCPTWSEMSFVKSLFWGDDETVLEFHPKLDAYVNRHQFCLHLWRKRGRNAELPPRELIG